MRDRINDEYFEWIFDLVCRDRYARDISYKKLLKRLHDIEFTFSISKDRNRAEDGIDLRKRFASLPRYNEHYESVLDDLYGPCSVLEMMVALAIRCEENIMDDPRVGDRTKQWFWGMVNNLGLGSMNDDRFDDDYVDDVIAKFLNRDYEPDGEGGLFRVKRCEVDLRTVEIWYQLCWYLDTIT